jgi:hypothetical protein
MLLVMKDNHFGSLWQDGSLTIQQVYSCLLIAFKTSWDAYFRELFSRHRTLDPATQNT